MTAPEAIIVDGLITNHEEIKRFYANRYRRQDIIRAGMFADLRVMDAEKQASTLAGDQPEPQPWQRDQWQSVRQMKGMMLHLDKQVKEALAKKKTEQGEY